jgi:hypothetical protein
VTIFRPVDPTGFFPVGDVAMNNYRKPEEYAMVVYHETGKTAPPDGFELVWNDKLSIARHGDVAIYKMICPTGFSSLGDVAIGSHTAQPDKNLYRSGFYNYVCIYD